MARISTTARIRVNYALDLSHLNILAVQTNHVEWSLVHELLSSPHCLEIHLSDNHGYGDQHLPLSNPHALPWWWSLLSSANPNATIFQKGGKMCLVQITFLIRSLLIL